MSVVVAIMSYQDSVELLCHVHRLCEARLKPECRGLVLNFRLKLGLDAKRGGRDPSAQVPLVVKRDNTTKT